MNTADVTCLPKNIPFVERINEMRRVRSQYQGLENESQASAEKLFFIAMTRG